VYRIVRRPVVKLVEGTQRIAQGDLDTRIDVTSRDELGQLAAAFNGMTADLHVAREEANQWSQQLEQKVVEKTAELGRIQRQVLLMEKMASLGKLAATVAHELNNPLGGILNYAKLVERVLRDEPLDEAGKRDVQHYLTAIQQESRRSGDIVRNLLLFARPSRTRFAPVRMSQIIDRSLLLINHRLAMSSIRCEHLPPTSDDLLTCDPDQIQQVLVALLVNAIEAMEEGGVLRLTVTPQPDLIELVVSDTGVGIPEDAIGHIFEPFFSTKDKESGVGLGLAVVYGIVRGHGGTIDVTSEPSKGATFTVRLPRNPAPTDHATEDSNVSTEG
jgi:two-component system NtrC family sensor kinase